MNGNKAKMLRKLAGPASPTQYTVMKGTVRGKFMNTSAIIGTDGKPVLDEDDNETFNRINWTTKTIMIGAGTRMISKVLKNIYHNRTRGLPINIHTPVGA